MFNKNKPAESVATESNVTYITGIALEDSVDGEVLVQIGDPIEALMYEEDLEVTIEVDPDETDDSFENIDEDELAEEPGEDDEIEEEEEEEIFYDSDGDGDDDDSSDEIPPDDEDFEGNPVEEVTE